MKSIKAALDSAPTDIVAAADEPTNQRKESNTLSNSESDAGTA
jgi:hypothetical protein